MDRNDLISRSELKSVLQNECFWCANRDEPCDKSCWHCINEKIDNAPTVETDIEVVAQDAYKQGYADGWKERFGEPNERPQDKWIPVSERWPSFSGLYLVSIDDLVTVANFTGAYFINRKGLMVDVSAWQELPEPYKKDGADMRQADEPDKQITIEEYMQSLKGEN